MSTTIEVTSLSTKGQIIIPNSIRKTLHLETGDKLMIVLEGDCILLKPILKPGKETFSRVMEIGDRIRKELDLKEDDVNKAIRATRKTNARRH